MQAGRIDIGTVYAILDPFWTGNPAETPLVRLKVLEVVTVRNMDRRVPTSTVTGSLQEPDRLGKRVEKLPADKIMGEWTAYQELVTKQRQETARRRAEEETRQRRAENLARILGDLAGDKGAAGTTYNGGVEIRTSFVEKLTEKLGVLFDAETT